MLDIKGQQVNIGDKVLMGSSYGLHLTKFKKETKVSFVFECGSLIPKFIKGQWVGYDTVDDATGLPWDMGSFGVPGKNIGNRKIIYKGDNGTGYKLVDKSNEKISKILLVDSEFEL